MKGIIKNQLMLKLFILFIQFTLIHFASISFSVLHPLISVMAPLFDQNSVHEMECDGTCESWSELRRQLKTIKSAGVDAVSTDVWWGIVEGGEPGVYNWSYYDKLVNMLREENLRWIPILSFHQLGGNVGDNGYIPIPKYIWSRYKKNEIQFPNEKAMKFKSEQGNFSEEYVSFWATSLIAEDLKRFMKNFRDHFATERDLVEEINISLGPSGELRYPSYNQHDREIQYPSRGALQAYSLPAVEGFKIAMKEKYGTIENLNESWKFGLNSFDQIYPPNPRLLSNHFFSKGEQYSAYGKDFFDYYNEVLVQHGKLMFSIAESVFSSENSTFKNIKLSGKIPSVHWGYANRLPELCSGLIRTSIQWWNLLRDYGYENTVKVFESAEGQMKRVLIFTAIELSDNRDMHLAAESKAHELAHKISEVARKHNIEVQGENALGSELSNPEAWENIKNSLAEGDFSQVTLLRLPEITEKKWVLEHLKKLHQSMHESSSEMKCGNLFRN